MTKILIIDDYDSLRGIYRDRLIKEGYEVVEANSLLYGISEIFRTEDFDLVLLDINMPGSRGDKLMQIVEDYDVSFKVIVSSAYTVEQQKGFIPNANDYFDKGDGIETLIQKVKKVLQ
jgi:two-component system, OmpR family, response regulator